MELETISQPLCFDRRSLCEYRSRIYQSSWHYRRPGRFTCGYSLSFCLLGAMEQCREAGKQVLVCFPEERAKGKQHFWNGGPESYRKSPACYICSAAGN